MTPRQGDLWMATLGATRGHEQGGTRPCLVVSAEAYNRLPIEMAMVIPLTARDRNLRFQPRIEPGAVNELDAVSLARPEDLRAISNLRLGRPLGRARDENLAEVQAVLRRFLGL